MNDHCRGTYANPILPGFHPDPSICRVGDDYYLVTSTFEWFPGLPIHHSRDLVHWRLLGHVLDRPSQLPLDGVPPSGGLFAPTIRHWRGTFYVVCTLMHGMSANFVVTATDPAGPWSEPYWLEDTEGFDPSLFFDGERAWLTATRPADDQGHTEIWLREFDPEAKRLTGTEYVLWYGAVRGAVWAEAPHLYQIGKRYYLLIAEGGTGHDHAVTVARADHITGPYKGNPRNPILTHRHLGRDHPIVGTGHADLVQTPDGEWWAVLLAMRPYGGYHYNLGRETFLAPVTWEDGWPLMCPDTGRLELRHPRPALPEHRWPADPACDNFESTTLAPYWNMLRTPREKFWSLTERPGHLRLRLGPATAADLACPSLIARRQCHADFAAHTALDFIPHNEYESAGLLLIQNNDFHIRYVVTLRRSGRVLRLVRRARGMDTTVCETPIPDGRVYLAVEAHGQEYAFRHASDPNHWHPFAETVDGRILSTPVAGGFTGTYIGMYATGDTNNAADFDWFDYRPLPER